MATDGDTTHTHSRSAFEGGPEDVEERLPTGFGLGRYTVLRFVGRGGMGAVYAAYDAMLDRRVAIKLIRNSGTGERLVREARALAKLSHPNVVAVHEVGEIDGRVFLAMEFVEGVTLDVWLQTIPRSSADRVTKIVDALIQAAEGLAAAHDAGLVHRDFKPSNVMIGRDGRVRVLDFGLARAEASLELHGDASIREGDVRPVSPGSRVTRTDVVVGTPRYMAPEQRVVGGVADSRADQFSFCVVAFEALFGRHPFDTYDVLRQGGPVSTDVPWGQVPAQLRPILERGLSRRPSRRFRSMRDLVRALPRAAPTPAPVRRTLVAGLTLGVVLGAAVALGSTEDAPRPGCEAPRERIDGAWGERRKMALSRHFSGLDRELGPEAASLVAQRLDALVRAWAEEYGETCRATWNRGEQSPGRLDARMACIRQWEQELEAVVDALFAIEATGLERALDATGVLDGVERCRDPERAALPEGDAAPLWLELTRAEALIEAEELDQAVERLQSVRPKIEALDDPGLDARLTFLQARAFDASGSDELRALLESAHVAALRAGDDDLAARAAAGIADFFAAKDHDLRLARSWSAVATALADRSGDPQTVADALASAARLANTSDEQENAEILLGRAIELLDSAGYGALSSTLELELTRATWVFESGRPEAARDLLDRIHAEVNPRRARGSYLMPMLLLARARIERVLGHSVDALVLAEVALRRFEEAFGKEGAAVFHLERGWIRGDLGMLEAAIGDFEVAAALATAEFGADHPFVAESLMHLGSARRRQGDLVRARIDLAKSRGAYERAFGPDDTMLAMVQGELGLLHRDAAEHHLALDAFERALELDRKADATRDIALRLQQLGDTLALVGRSDEAEGRLIDAARTLRPVADARDPLAAEIDVSLGAVLRRTGRPEPALALQEPAVAVLQSLPAPVPDHALAEVALTLLALGRTDEALAYARRLPRSAVGPQHPSVRELERALPSATRSAGAGRGARRSSPGGRAPSP